jgi:hypothetical protein
VLAVEEAPAALTLTSTSRSRSRAEHFYQGRPAQERQDKLGVSVEKPRGKADSGGLILRWRVGTRGELGRAGQSGAAAVGSKVHFCAERIRFEA